MLRRYVPQVVSYEAAPIIALLAALSIVQTGENQCDGSCWPVGAHGLYNGKEARRIVLLRVKRKYPFPLVSRLRINTYSLSFPPRIGVRGKLQRESRATDWIPDQVRNDGHCEV